MQSQAERTLAMQKHFEELYKNGQGLTLQQIAWRFHLPTKTAKDYLAQLQSPSPSPIPHTPAKSPSVSPAPKQSKHPQPSPTIAESSQPAYHPGEHSRHTINNLTGLLVDIFTYTNEQEGLFHTFTKEVQSW